MKNQRTSELFRSRLVFRLMFGLVAIFVFPALTPLQAETSVEYKVKAVFLFKLTKFVEWPSGSFTSDGPFVIGVLGEDPFGQELDKVCKGEEIGGRTVSVKRGGSLEDLKDSHVIFVSRSEKKEFARILSALEKQSVLTVADSDTFMNVGGMINFVPKGTRISFEISPKAIKEAGLRVSSKVLRLGIVKK